MFEIGFSEMLLVGVVALLVIGPERLPAVAAKTGRFIAKARAFVANTRSDLEREFQTDELRKLLNKQEDEIRELRDIMRYKTDSLHREIREAGALVESSVRQSVIAATPQAETAPLPISISKPLSVSDDTPKHG